jgi:hypothetical protein
VTQTRVTAELEGADTTRRCYSRCVRRGRILAIKWGMNPNSSSLGVDVTFLLVGATVLAAVTPVIGALLRWRRRVPVEPPGATTAPAPPT